MSFAAAGSRRSPPGVGCGLVAAAIALGACSRSGQRAEPESVPTAASTTPLVSVPNAAEAGTRDESSAHADAADAAAIDAGAARGKCKVAVVRLIEGTVYRGPGVDSPARQKTLDGLSNDQRQRWEGRDHGVRHLACTYAVSVNGIGYRYRHNAEQDFTNRGLDSAKCATDETQREVERRIAEFTKKCTDLHAGEYWGYRLDPLPP